MWSPNFVMCASYVGPVLLQGTSWANNAREKETLLDSVGIYNQGEGITQTIRKCRYPWVGYVLQHKANTKVKPFTQGWRSRWVTQSRKGSEETLNLAGVQISWPFCQETREVGEQVGSLPWLQPSSLWVHGASQGFQLSGFLRVS